MPSPPESLGHPPRPPLCRDPRQLPAADGRGTLQRVAESELVVQFVLEGFPKNLRSLGL